MPEGSTPARSRNGRDGGHASRCELGAPLRRSGFLCPPGEGLQQRVRGYPPMRKVGRWFVALLAGAKAICHNRHHPADPAALPVVRRRPSRADQALGVETREAVTEPDAAERRPAIATRRALNAGI